MQRAVTVSLLLLALITFFLGLNLGKRIQQIDTPIYTTVVVTRIQVTKVITPTLSQVTEKPIPLTQILPNDTPEATP